MNKKSKLNEGRYADLERRLTKKNNELKELKIKLRNAPTADSREEIENSIDICQNDIANIESELAEIRYLDNGSAYDYSGYVDEDMKYIDEAYRYNKFEHFVEKFKDDYNIIVEWRFFVDDKEIDGCTMKCLYIDSYANSVWNHQHIQDTVETVDSILTQYNIRHYTNTLDNGKLDNYIYVCADDLYKFLNEGLEEGVSSVYLDVLDDYHKALAKAEKSGHVTYTVETEDDEEEFDTWKSAVVYAKKHNIDKIHVSEFGFEGPDGYDNGDYEEYEEQVLDLNKEPVKEGLTESFSDVYKVKVYNIEWHDFSDTDAEYELGIEEDEPNYRQKIDAWKRAELRKLPKELVVEIEDKYNDIDSDKDLDYYIEEEVYNKIGYYPKDYKFEVLARPTKNIPDGFVEFEGYPTEVGEVGRELITRDGEHIWITDYTEDDGGFWASRSYADVKTGRGHYWPADKIKYVKETVEESLKEEQLCEFRSNELKSISSEHDIIDILNNKYSDTDFTLKPGTFEIIDSVPGYVASYIGGKRFDKTNTKDIYDEIVMLTNASGSDKYYVGQWVDNNGKVCIDKNASIDDFGEAIIFGINNNQDAIYNFDKDKVIKIDKNTKEITCEKGFTQEEIDSIKKLEGEDSDYVVISSEKLPVKIKESLKESNEEKVVEETKDYKIVKTNSISYKSKNGVAVGKPIKKPIFQVYFRTQDFNPSVNRWMNRGWSLQLTDFETLEDARAYVKKYGKELKDDLEEDYYDESAVKVAKRIAKALKLSKYDLNTLIHDINNLRGSEWLEQVESIGDEELLKQFKEVAQLEDLEEEYVSGYGDINTVDECNDVIYKLHRKLDSTKDGYWRNEYIKDINKLIKLRTKLEANAKGEFVSTNKLYNDIYKIAGLEKIQTRTTAIRGYRPIYRGQIEITNYNDGSYDVNFYSQKDKVPAVVDGLKKLGYNIKSEGKDSITVLNYLTKEHDLEEDIEKHDTLNPAIFDVETEEMLPEVREKLLEIVNHFVDGVHDDELDLDVKDTVLIGSNANYNYTKDSDLDIHIIASSKPDCNKKHLNQIYQAYKSMFNKNYDIYIHGYPAEVYVEMDEVNARSGGIYSIKDNKWLKQPKQFDIPDIDYDALYKEVDKWEERYFELVNYLDEYENASEEVDKYIDDIYEVRKNGIAEDGEFSVSNLVFKEIRNRGYLDNLKQLKTELASKEMSLENLDIDNLKENKYNNKEVENMKKDEKTNKELIESLKNNDEDALTWLYKHHPEDVKDFFEE